MVTRTKKRPTHLRSVPKPSAVEHLLSGRVSKTAPRPKARTKRGIPPQDLPKEMKPIANLFVAGRSLEKEISLKLSYAKQKLEEYCIRDWIQRFAGTSRKPPSIDYTSDHSKFKFVMTSRTTLTREKAEALQDLGIAIDEHTELRDVEINYEAIRQHRLEAKLMRALESLDVSQGVIEECFTPKVELRDTFYDVLAELVRRSLGPGEKLEDKMFDVLEILNPANQVRNTEVVGLSAEKCFELIHRTEVEVEEEVA